MRKMYIISVLLSMAFTQSVLADIDNNAVKNLKGGACAAVANACKSAGLYNGAKIWLNCMKPVLLGQSVKGVTVDAEAVKTCRANKIERMKHELAEFEAVK